MTEICSFLLLSLPFSVWHRRCSHHLSDCLWSKRAVPGHGWGQTSAGVPQRGRLSSEHRSDGGETAEGNQWTYEKTSRTSDPAGQVRNKMINRSCGCCFSPQGAFRPSAVMCHSSMRLLNRYSNRYVQKPIDMKNWLTQMKGQTTGGLVYWIWLTPICYILDPTIIPRSYIALAAYWQMRVRKVRTRRVINVFSCPSETCAKRWTYPSFVARSWIMKLFRHKLLGRCLQGDTTSLQRHETGITVGTMCHGKYVVKHRVVVKTELWGFFLLTMNDFWDKLAFKQKRHGSIQFGTLHRSSFAWLICRLISDSGSLAASFPWSWASIITFISGIKWWWWRDTLNIHISFVMIQPNHNVNVGGCPPFNVHLATFCFPLQKEVLISMYCPFPQRYENNSSLNQC